jgi:hypothetical protein
MELLSLDPVVPDPHKDFKLRSWFGFRIMNAMLNLPRKKGFRVEDRITKKFSIFWSAASESFLMIKGIVSCDSDFLFSKLNQYFYEGD